MRNLEILYEDDDVFVVFKDAGLLSEATRRHEAQTVESILGNILRKGQPRSRRHVFLVHRLDRDTAGVMVVAKNGMACDFLKSCWHEAVVKRYFAVTLGVPPCAGGTLKGWLYEDSNLFVRQVPEDGRGQFLAANPEATLKYAETVWEKISERRGLALLRLTLRTGRRNQIRVQLADAGWPVLGDRKYGRPAKSGNGHLHLHAYGLSFPLPSSGVLKTFEVLPTRGMFAPFARSIETPGGTRPVSSGAPPCPTRHAESPKNGNSKLT